MHCNAFLILIFQLCVNNQCKIYNLHRVRYRRINVNFSISHFSKKIQDMIARVNQTLFGKYISPSHVYLSSTRPSIYAAGSRGHGWLAGEEQKKYVIVYPFIKTREWYLLPLEKIGR